MNPVRICEIMVVLGIAAQGVGMYYLTGWQATAVLIGTESALIGITGILRA